MLHDTQRQRFLKAAGPALLACLVLLLSASAPAQAAVSLAGVHDFSGDTGLVDPNAPFGERGWAVELVPTVAACRGNLAGERSGGVAAKNAGMQVIYRVDYKQANGRQVAVPVNSGEYAQWVSDFNQCITKLSDLSSLFIVGNEPNLDYDVSKITYQQYAAAFNYLYPRKSGGQLLATFNSPFTEPEWMGSMSNLLNNVDGWAIHTGAIRGSCTDPRQPCFNDPNWWFDNAFRYYRDIIANIAKFRTKPAYITEFNTYAGGAAPHPQDNYQDGWANKAYEEIRNYNATRGSNAPEIRALCWFTDKVRGGFDRFSLRNIPTALQDMKDAFRNPANRGGGGGTTCPTGTLGVPGDRWRMHIWNNRTFTNSPVERRYDAVGSKGFSFNWGSGRPSNCTGNDNYSIRFNRNAFFSTTGTYTFTVTADDGVRLWVDGVQIINQWKDQAPTTYTANRYMTAGTHSLRVDYYENGGGASVSLDWTLNGGGGGGNGARIEEGLSSVPGSMAPNETRNVSVRVTNTGGTTWKSGTLHRLAARGNNSVTWGGWPCGGYSSTVNDARIFLCNDVPPGGGYTFNFTIRAPSSGTGVFRVEMVQDGVDWFGEVQTWNIPVSGGGGGNPYPGCPCNRTDNYCQHGPNTPGCPMTFGGGYCDWDGNGSYSDGDWVRGYNEYNTYCN